MNLFNNQNTQSPRLGHKLSLITYALFLVLFVLIAPKSHSKGTVYEIVLNLIALYIIVSSFYYGFIAKEVIIPGKYNMYDEKGYKAMFYAILYILIAIGFVVYAFHKGYISY